MTNILDSPALQELIPAPRWVVYIENKCPYNPVTGKPAEADDPTTWATYEEARSAATRSSGRFKGIGREVTAEDRLVVIDLDKCIDENGTVSDFAQDIVSRVNSYTEISPSGRGLHIWAHGTIPANLVTAKPKPDGIEMYYRGRYLTWTGNHLEGTPLTIEDRSTIAQAIYQETITRREALKASARTQKQFQAPQSTPASNGHARYAEAALRDECRVLASAQDGCRNDQLNGSAFNMGTLVGAGVLGRALAESELYDAAARTGLPLDEIEKHIKHGIDDGIQHPRDLRDLKNDWVEYKPSNEQATNGNGNGQHAKAPQEGEEGERKKGRPPTTDVKDNAVIAAWWHEKYKGQVIYNKSNQAWYSWNGRYWENLQDTEGQRKSCYTIDKMVIALLDAKDIPVRSNAQIDNIIRLAAVKSQQDMPTRQNCLNFANGTLDIATLTKREHRKEDYLTHCLPYDYIPGGHPVISKFLEEVIPDVHARQAYIAHIGLGLVGDTRMHYGGMIYGEPRAGKSTLLRLANAACGIRPSDFAGDSLFSIDIEGKRSRYRWNTQKIVCVDELSVEALRNEGIVKDMLAHSGVEMRGIGRDEQKDNQWCPKILMAANEKPHYKDTTSAIRERIIPINVPNKRPKGKRDLELFDKMLPELGAFAHTCILHALAARKRGYYPMSARMQAVLEEMSGTGNPLKSFLAEECVLIPDEQIFTNILYQAYSKYCDDSRNKPLAKPNMTSALLEMGLGITPKSVRNKDNANKVERALIGLRLRQEDDPYDDDPTFPADDLLFPLDFVDDVDAGKGSRQHTRQHVDAAPEGASDTFVDDVDAILPIIAYKENTEAYKSDRDISLYKGSRDEIASTRQQNALDAPVVAVDNVDAHVNSSSTSRQHVNKLPPVDETPAKPQLQFKSPLPLPNTPVGSSPDSSPEKLQALAWGEAHGWPRFPLNTHGSSAIAEGEGCWRLWMRKADKSQVDKLLTLQAANGRH
jgi:putative DNA primase/helicase